MVLVFIFCGLIACAGKPVSASCPVEMIPSSVVVRYGDSVSVNCSSSSDQTEGMGWESPYGGISLTEGVFSLVLEINSVKAWVIESNCFINLPEDQCSKKLSITVYKMADSVSMSPPSQIGSIVEGKMYSMQCDIANVAPASNLSVYWHKGNNIFHTETFEEELGPSPVNLSSVLNLIAHRDDNGTQIWCEVKLNFGPLGPDLPALQSKSSEVIVLYPPTFIKPEKEEVILEAGGKISLNCTATGNPMPLYSWHLPHPMFQKNENQPILTPSQPGIYNCTVSNTQGNNIKHFIVKAARNQTTLAAVIGVFVTLGALLFIGGLLFVTPQGTFSFCNGSYLRGQPTSSGPI